MMMGKRFFAGAKSAVIPLMILAMLLAMVPSVWAAEPYVYYVYTENGKSLNVRAAPGGEVIDQIAYGTPVTIFEYDPSGAWALIHYGPHDLDGFVMVRYLVRQKPESKKPSGSGAVTPSKTTDDTLDMVNAQFQMMQAVPPYAVQARPSRAGGFVNMRWAPSTDMRVIQRCYEGHDLLVIAQNNTWAQVKDPASGQVGFMVRKYLQNASSVGTAQ